MFYQPIYIAGPTASGKTGVSIELAKRLSNAEIINADAYQVYQGIDTLSAAPTPDEQEAIPHHLFTQFPIDHECDAASFANLARTTINQVANRAIPIVVGGSGLYLKSITHGLAPTPPGDEKLRQKLDQKSLEELVEDYQKLDPEGAAKTNLQNRRYVTRNLEICLLSGQPASQLKAEWENNAPEFTGIFLSRPRQETYDRINRRTHLMFADGVVDEVADLPAEPSTTAAKAIGLREIQALLRAEITEIECIETIQKHTRRYAKRQETWFKKESQYQRIPCHSEDTSAEIVDRIVEIFPLSDLQSQKSSEPCPKSNQETQPESR